MRRFGPLIVLTILVIVGGLGFSYYVRLKQQNSTIVEKPKQLPEGINSAGQEYTFTQHKDGKPVAFIRAKDFREVNGKYELVGVELHIFQKDGTKYDQVKCEKAEFDIKEGTLFSDGDVEIMIGVNPDEPPSGKLMKIKTSGVHFETKTGKASTDRPATFQFDRGDGHAVGADYDPNTRVLSMRSQIELIWRGTDSHTVPMKVQTDQLTYAEHDSKVYLANWSKLTRDTLTLEAGPAIVTLDHGNGAIKLVETSDAHGIDRRPARKLEYAADQLRMEFDGKSEVQRIIGANHARLIDAGETAVNTITADNVDLDFDTANKTSTLRTALTRGHSVVHSKPIVKPGADPAETRILKSDVVKTTMREGGREIAAMETGGPGALEFVPNREGQPHRYMDGGGLWITYGPKNQIQSVKAVNASTRTENPPAKGAKAPPPPAVTSSKDLLATFLPNSSQIDKLEQTSDFKYDAGDRHARADRADIDQPKNVITLIKGARIWDATGTADADKIVLDQKTGDFTAEGNVNSTRLPDKSKDANSDSGSLLSEDDPLHATAKKMSSANNHLLVRYEGSAVLWQGANRLQAEYVEIDRDNNFVKAHGHVVSELLDKAKDDPKDDPKADPKIDPKVAPKKSATKAAGPVFTIIKAPELEYKDDDKIAVYKGGAMLNRQTMQVKANEIRAFLRTDSDDSSLDHAFADGKVEIYQTAPGRTRTGNSEHAEYYVDDDKVTLKGGDPQFADSVRGKTRGSQLTWFSKDDRLLVNGVENQPVNSVLRRKNAQQHP
jgi:lipopolysaccharide export system protein LptA